MNRNELMKYQELAAELGDIKKRLFLSRSEAEIYGLYHSLLEKKQTELEQELAALEKFIEAIPDSGLRLLFRYYFIDGKTQSQIAEIMHTDRSVVSRKIQNCFKQDCTQKHKKGSYIVDRGAEREEQPDRKGGKCG